MSWLYAFKPQEDRAMYSASLMLLAAGVTPNMVTAAGMHNSVSHKRLSFKSKL